MNSNIGEKIKQKRKEKNMTQQELAKKLNITDKAVSKWERNLSYPDISIRPLLCEILDMDTNDFLGLEQNKLDFKNLNKSDFSEMINLTAKCVGLALGIGVLVLNILKEISVNDSIILLSLCIVCFGIVLLQKK